uniref:Enhancer of polycomb-like protein n=1 Tax=Mycena chlorophos TaxID=658473 RepID=A0ABQ0KVW9_MYCCL|nr:predicted protein [Mycena chlorophos]
MPLVVVSFASGNGWIGGDKGACFSCSLGVAWDGAGVLVVDMGVARRVVRSIVAVDGGLEKEGCLLRPCRVARSMTSPSLQRHANRYGSSKPSRLRSPSLPPPPSHSPSRIHAMPRILNTPSALRNRNRITNKYRLKIYKGDLETEPYIHEDDDDDKSKSTLAVAGVDQEDANEHHLQAVLSEAARRNQGTQRATRGSSDKKAAPAPAAYIPTPDSTGLVDNYAQLYPCDRWRDPITYVCSSQTVEEAIADGLANEFTYFMDDRDKEWLDKNNEEARGEGTSAQGAVSSTLRASARSSKAKGKEPEQHAPVAITMDELELTMGLFEKITHEKTEHLHLSLNGMEFPPLADYLDVFCAELLPSDFAAFQPPKWVPSPSKMVQIARAVYPHWKERRLEREGHRIMPTLNGDESDLANESYVCFRRREIKSVRKTRAQVTSSDKLQRLQSEFIHPVELATLLLTRESLKAEEARQAQEVWQKRLELVDLKRKYPVFVGDEDLFVDKERPTKRPEPTPRLPGLKIKTPVEPPVPAPRVEPMMRPQARSAMIQSKVDIEVTRQRDHGWEDGISNSYQPTPISLPSRLFRHLSLPDRRPQAMRARRGRGGRIMLDRRSTLDVVSHPRSSRFASSSDADMDDEDARRIEERWRFDSDDVPAAGPEGFDEQDRVLIDDYEPKYLRHTMTLLSEADQQNILNDPVLQFTSNDGREVTKVVGFRLGIPFPRRDPVARGATPMISQHNSAQTASAMAVNGPPIASQMKKLPSVGQPMQQMPRISSNGGMRPPVVASMPSHVSNGMPVQTSPPRLQASPAPASLHAPMSQPHIEQPTPPMNVPGQPEGMVNVARPKSQNQFVNGGPPNGFPMSNGFVNGGQFVPSGANLSLQQMQNIKSAFAAANSPSPDMQQRQMGSPYMQIGVNGAGFALPNGVNMNLKLPPSRSMSNGWTPMRPNSVVNGVDNSGLGLPMNGHHSSLSPSPGHRHAIAVPVRTPSANGMMGMSPHLQHASPPMMHGSPPLMSQSPPRGPMTPMPMSSPMMQPRAFY